MTNPMTAPGDLITGGTAGAAQALPVGADGYHMIPLGGVPAWQFYEAVGVTNLSGANPTTSSPTGPGSCSGNLWWDYSGPGALWVYKGGWFRMLVSPPPLDAAAAVPTTAPAQGHMPFKFDSTPASGGLYGWTGSAWVKLSTIP
jgi:hypothetical protein